MTESALAAMMGPLPDAAQARREIFRMTDAAERAVLHPSDPGGIPHPLRSALAARVAALHEMPDIAAHYGAAAGEFAAIADPSIPATAREAAICAFIDTAAARTSEARAEDISALTEAGISDADIVRLAELGAFLAYQVRVVVGLRLLVETGA